MLLGNYSVLHKSPGRFFAGSTTSVEPQASSNWNKSGAARNSLYVSQRTAALVLYAIPSGNYAGKTWMLPQKSGEMQSRFDAVARMSGTAAGARGVNLTASSSVVFSVANADLQLVVSASGSATVTFSASSALAGALQATGGTSFSFTLPATTLGAIINAQASASFALSGAGTPRAVGSLAGDITPFTELSPQNLAAAVWSAIAASNNTAGTMGSKLNSAASGGVDYAAMADAVRAELAAELARLDAAISSRQAGGAVVDADVRYVNGVEIGGTGTPGDTWGPA